MNLLICIDDTDNLESRGTGELADMMADGMVRGGWGKRGPVTRHQLLVHEDIPYTSHNSAMCFAMELTDPDHLQRIRDYAEQYLTSESARGSDPGLAVAMMDALREPDAVMEFGRRAKREVLTKEAAYAFAHDHGIALSEHGGSGQGVIGALAGIGLRLSGCDGRVRGHFKPAETGTMMSAEDLLHHPQISDVRAIDGPPLPHDIQIEIGEKVKTVWLDHRAVLLVAQDERGVWRTCGKQQLRRY